MTSILNTTNPPYPFVTLATRQAIPNLTVRPLQFKGRYISWLPAQPVLGRLHPHRRVLSVAAPQGVSFVAASAGVLVRSGTEPKPSDAAAAPRKLTTQRPVTGTYVSLVLGNVPATLTSSPDADEISSAKSLELAAVTSSSGKQAHSCIQSPESM